MKYLEEKHLTAIRNIRLFDKLLTKAPKGDRRPPTFVRDTMAVNELTVVDATGTGETPQGPRA
jgi:hypothetical protein